MLTELRIAGFGGQGVILAAHIIGNAVTLIEKGYATMTQNYGPEARGGAASAALVLSDEPVLYPYLTEPGILIAMSLEAYTKFGPEVKEGGFLLVEEDLVQLDALPKVPKCKIYGIPATRFAEELGKKMVLNVIMVGFFSAITKAVSPEACRAGVEHEVPKRFVDLNVKAFNRGYEYGLDVLSRQGERTRPGEEMISGLELENHPR
ncbi:MAG: pyruvate ferredoxin oxidoreductase [Candidatus Solibacter sp.]|nr:pyruvate ferredoxin oxidoreductase [Candidatus Solibacter sp.]